MVKKAIGILAVLCVLGGLMLGSCEAMTMSKPVKIGRANGTNIGGFAFQGETSNNGNIVRRRGTSNVYGKGIACFGKGRDSLFLHYADVPNYMSRMGGEDFNNTVNILCEAMDIYQIQTDENIMLYLLYSNGDMFFGKTYTLLGRRADGRFVKYFYTYDLLWDYFGGRFAGGRCVDLGVAKPIIVGDTIVFRVGMGEGVWQCVGELRLKWDPAAQWFSVEAVRYDKHRPFSRKELQRDFQ